MEGQDLKFVDMAIQATVNSFNNRFNFSVFGSYSTKAQGTTLPKLVFIYFSYGNIESLSYALYNTQDDFPFFL
jgi:hypothetical protein